jgi:hypothetical protein
MPKMDAESRHVLLMTEAQRLERLTQLDPTAGSLLTEFIEAHQSSGVFRHQTFERTSDGIEMYRMLDRRFIHKSHIISRQMSKAFGIQSFNKAGNLLLESLETNMARAAGLIYSNVGLRSASYNVWHPNRVPQQTKRLHNKTIYIPADGLRPIRLLAMRVDNALRNFMNREEGAREQAAYHNLIAAGENPSEPRPRAEKLESQERTNYIDFEVGMPAAMEEDDVSLGF